MHRKAWVRRLTWILVLSLLLQTVGAPLATVRLVQQMLAGLEKMQELHEQAQGVLAALQEVNDNLAPVVVAASPMHDPGDTDAEDGCADCADPCKDGANSCSQVQYDNRALTLSAVCGSVGLPLVALYNSRYELKPVMLAPWVPTEKPITEWEIRIQGWSFKGEGARPLALWDTTDRATGKPVPAGLYYYEVTYGNELGQGSTTHPVVVRRASDGPLGFNWTHTFQGQLVPVDDSTILLDTGTNVQLFTRQSKDTYVLDNSTGGGKLIRQVDGTWQWTRDGGDGAPVSGILTFDAQGRMTSFRDANGEVTQFAYDSQGRLVRVTDPQGMATILEYESSHIVGVTDAAGQRWRLAYQDGHLVEVTDPLGSRWQMAYDAAHRLIERRDPRGNVTRYQYDSDGGITSVVDATGSVTAFESALHTEPLLELNPKLGAPEVGTTTVIRRSAEGNETSRELYGFDAMGHVVRAEVSPDGGATVYIWRYVWGWGKDGDKLLAVTNPNGDTVTYDYQAGTDLLARIDGPGKQQARFSYQLVKGRGWLLTSAQAGSTERRWEYDQQGLLRRVLQGPLHFWVQWTDVDSGQAARLAALIWNWDGKGDPTTVPSARIIRYEYDSSGRVVAVVDPIGRRTTLAYDDYGRLKGVTDALGRSEALEYDVLGRIVAYTDALGHTTRYAYDENGNLIEVVDARGNRITYAYDEKDRLIARTDPLGRSLRLGYDNEGRLAWREDGRGARVCFTYDGLGRMTQVIMPTGETWRVEYDALGLVTRADNGTDDWRFEYNAEGLISQASLERDGRTSTLAYEYDTDGRVRKLKADGVETRYSYGQVGELVGIESPLGNVRFKYNTVRQLAPQLVEVSSGSLVGKYSYDEAGRLSELSYSHSRWQAGAVTSYRYAYDAADNVIALTVGAETTRYEYDALDQLTAVTYADGSQVRYTYDEVGNRLREESASGVIEYRYDAANQLVTAGNRRYSYDDNGNLVGVWEGGRGRVYTWDYQGQLRGVAERTTGSLPFPFSLAASSANTTRELAGYRYDLFGRLSTISRGEGSSRELLVDQEHVIAVTQKGETIARSVYGAQWDELRLQDAGEEGQVLYPLSDAMGTVLAGVDGQGQVHYQTIFDAWGRPRQWDASSPLPGFQGRPYDPETGLYQFRARYYDPEVGRFISPDPIQDPFMPRTLNGYVFGLNNPLRFRDPTGRILPIVVAIAIGAAIGAGYFGGRYWFANHDKSCFSWGELAYQAGMGALIGGAVAGIGYAASAYLIGALGVTTLAGQVGVGAVVGAGTGALGNIADQTLLQYRSPSQWNKTDILIAAGAGAIGGAVSVGVVSPFKAVPNPIGLANPGAATSAASGTVAKTIAFTFASQGISRGTGIIFSRWWNNVRNGPNQWY